LQNFSIKSLDALTSGSSASVRFRFDKRRLRAKTMQNFNLPDLPAGDPLREGRLMPLYAQEEEILFIAAIIFFSQNFSNCRKKNYQLDTLARTQ